MNLTTLRPLLTGPNARDAYDLQLRAVADQLTQLEQPARPVGRAAALDAAARAMALAGDLAPDVSARGRGTRVPGCSQQVRWYQLGRACRILASAEWARHALDEEGPDRVHRIHARDPLEDHPDVEPAFLRLCHTPDPAHRARLIRGPLAAALRPSLPDAGGEMHTLLEVVAAAYLQAATVGTQEAAQLDGSVDAEPVDELTGGPVPIGSPR
jgi:hypothetical protein